MPQTIRYFLITAFFALFATLAVADGIPPVNWDRGEAARSAALTDTLATREELQQLARAGDSENLLALVKATAGRDDWPVPAREDVLLDFTAGLRTLPPRSVAPEVMDFLRNYQPRVMVTNDDHPYSSLPMYNIRAAAHGVQNSWTRQAAAFEGAAILNLDPVLLVEAYRDTDLRPARQGLLDALHGATSGQLEAVCFLALAGMEQTPGLSALAGQAALLNGDARALEQLVRTGRGPALSHTLRQAKAVLTTDQLARLLHTAVREGPVDTASVAIAELAPALAGHQPTEGLLLDLLGDPALGSTAALALAKNPSTSTLRSLDRLAASGDEALYAVRARLALNINRSQFAGEVQE